MCAPLRLVLVLERAGAPSPFVLRLFFSLVAPVYASSRIARNDLVEIVPEASLFCYQLHVVFVDTHLLPALPNPYVHATCLD